jgi:uncharacterized protein (TIGR02099 family)
MPTLIKRLLHYAVYGAAAVVVAVCGVALYLRLVIMPNVDAYKTDIEAIAGSVIGMPIKIGAIEADWWGLNPRFSLRQARLVQVGDRPPLLLERVDATLSWLSLFVGDARLVNLALYGPRLEIRRDARGIVYVADIPVNTPGPKSAFPDWLLRQRHVVISEGRLDWRDDLIGAPPLSLDNVNLVLRNRSGRHQLGITAKPPAAAVAGLDIRAELSGASVHDPGEWQGRVYARADALSLEALRAWAPWIGKQARQGRGDARFWLDLKDGQVTGLTGDVRLADVAVAFAEDHPEMAFRDLSGRLGWSRNRDLHTLLAHGLSFTTDSGQRVGPSDVRVQTRIAPDGRMTLVGARAERLRVEALNALSAALPLPKALRDWLTLLQPRGYIEHAELDWESFAKYKLTARFQEAGMNAGENLPGFSGVSGRIVATGSGGEMQLDAKTMRFDLPKVFRQPLDFDRFSTDLAWERLGDGTTRLRIGETQLDNADVEARADGSIEFHPGRAPLLDLRAQARRGAGNAVWRYLPRQIGEHAYEWLKQAIVAGHSPETRMVLKGPLDHFPFDKGGGEFWVDIEARGAKLHYAPDWPAIEDIQGKVRFQGAGMRIEARSARLRGVQIGHTTAVIPDLHSSDAEMLNIDGQARGATSAFLDFIKHSPVHEHTGRFTERLGAEGEGSLNLHLRLPLRHLGDSTVRGDYRLIDNTVVPGKDMPSLTQVNGTLSFTENLLRGEALNARLFGLPATLRLSSEPGGRVRVGVAGRADANLLKTWLPAGMETYFKGAADYQADVSLAPRQTVLKIKSDLVGLAVGLPAPLDKPAAQALPFSLSSGDAEAGIALQIGQVVAARLNVDDKGETRANVYLGGGIPSAAPREAGVHVQGSLRKLDLDAWKALPLDTAGAAEAKPGPSLRAINLNVAELRAMGRVFHDTRIKATPIPKGWKIDLGGKEVAGDIMWSEAGGLPGKRLAGHFQRLNLPPAEAGGRPSPDIAPTELPRILEINAQSFSLFDREIGQLNTHMEAERTGLRTRSLVIANADGRLSGNGWVSASHRQATQFDIEVESANAGKLLARLGISEGIKGGATTLNGKISWPGRPEDFTVANLDGDLKLNMKSGRFTQLDPGAGRLLGILSLQALPRRIVLDFRDVFSEGFSFDSIDGEVHIQRGIAYLPDLVIKGPSTVVNMKGRIDLAREEQDLRVTIQPRLDDSLAVAGALLGGPAVGVGTFVATKILQNPVSKAATFEYLIKGTWSEPQVTKLPRPKAPAAESPLTP